jgi:acyloxyacyl hydrolase
VFVPAIDGRLMNGVNGGAECAGCTMVLGIIERVSIIYNESIVSALERICNFLPNEFRIYCKVAVDFLGKFDGFVIQSKEKEKFITGPIIIDGFSKKETSDVICHSLKICRTDPGQSECRLYQPGSSSPSTSLAQSGTILRQNHPLLTSEICTIPGIAEICKIIERAFKSRLPAVDIDGDRFGTEPTLRGTSWRGKDCDDFSSKIRPGARSVMGDYDVDHNCNGIVGMDSSTGRP